MNQAFCVATFTKGKQDASGDNDSGYFLRKTARNSDFPDLIRS